MLAFALALPAVVFYLYAAFRQWQTVTARKPQGRLVVHTTTMVGALLHLGSIGITMLGREHINFAIFEVGSLIAWVITLLLIFSSWRKPVDNLFIGLLPMAAVVLLCATFSAQYYPLPNLSSIFSQARVFIDWLCYN